MNAIIRWILLFAVVDLSAWAGCHAFQSTAPQRFFVGREKVSTTTQNSRFTLVPKLPCRTLEKRTFPTSLHATAPPFAAGSALSVIPKTLSFITTPVVTFLRLFMKDMRSLSTRQWAWWAMTLAAGYALGRMPPFWKRYTNVMDIPRGLYGQVMWGRAVSVSDGDTIRFLHQPTRWHPSTLRKGKKEKASETALAVRIATIDTPETPKFGKPGQPFGLEAKEALKALLGDGRVGLKILQPDQYGRAVGQVFVPPQIPWIGKPTMVDEFMLKKGLAEVYTGGGAVYGPLGLDAYLELQEEAKKEKLGIWSQGKRESAAEYKRRTKS
mmetsp:Transcript_5461/g.10596  ORF Transcript_5461/g.10596 Transcript_5461/m.10596 type:complete len:325 (-) Transcript_5461:103-1077(-)|eukprot:scaffold34620_cov160-Amphora_coffeaeformis.AAC.3